MEHTFDVWQRIQLLKLHSTQLLLYNVVNSGQMHVLLNKTKETPQVHEVSFAKLNVGLQTEQVDIVGQVEQYWTLQLTQVIPPELFNCWIWPIGHIHWLFWFNINVLSGHWHTETPLTKPGTKLLIQVKHILVDWHKLQLVTLQLMQVPWYNVVNDGHTQVLLTIT